MVKFFNFFRFLHNYKQTTLLWNKILYQESVMADQLKTVQHLSSQISNLHEMINAMNVPNEEVEEETVWDLSQLTLENTRGIKVRKSKNKGDRFVAYLALTNKDGETEIFHIGTYDTIQEAFTARLEYIQSLV